MRKGGLYVTLYERKNVQCLWGYFNEELGEPQGFLKFQNKTKGVSMVHLSV